MIRLYYKINGHKYELDWIAVHWFFYRFRNKFKTGGFIQKKIDKIMDYIHNEKIIKVKRMIDGLDKVKTEEI